MAEMEKPAVGPATTGAGVTGASLGSSSDGRRDSVNNGRSMVSLRLAKGGSDSLTGPAAAVSTA